MALTTQVANDELQVGFHLLTCRTPVLRKPSRVFFYCFDLLQARMVAAATTTLCDAANAAVQGNASEERLIAGAKQVSNSTAQLLLACRVKADSNSDHQRRLQVSSSQLD